MALGRKTSRCANTPEQRSLIPATVPILAEHGVTIATHFYRQMLEANPHLCNVFSHSKQQRGLRAEALARAVYAYAANIEDHTPILLVVKRIAHKHTSVHIVSSQYVIVAKHLLEAITQVVGADRELYDAAQWVGWRDFVVAKKVQESDEITSFYLKPKDGTPLEPSPRPVHLYTHPSALKYSLSDAPNPEYFPVPTERKPCIRAIASSGALDTTHAAHPGWTSNHLHATLVESDPIDVVFPFGVFFLDNFSPPIVLLSASVGLHPLLVMFNTLVKANLQREDSWVQAVRNERVHAFGDYVRKVREAADSLASNSPSAFEPPSAAEPWGMSCQSPTLMRSRIRRSCSSVLAVSIHNVLDRQSR
ncbi:hypothetical protein VTO73DRAFT_2861 [Trametes versicolor]